VTISRSKVALVTGANKGIGKAIVKSVARSVLPNWKPMGRPAQSSKTNNSLLGEASVTPLITPFIAEEELFVLKMVEENAGPRRRIAGQSATKSPLSNR
jgi:hypothetical protein